MTQPTIVFPDVLYGFTEPRSGTQVAKESNLGKTMIWNQMRLARRKGFIAPVGKRKDPLTSCTRKLYEITAAGVDYLEANNE